MRTQLEGLAKVLAQTTALQDLFEADDAADVLSVNTFYGTSQDAEAALPSNYAVYALAAGSGFSVMSMGGDCVIKTPRIQMTLYISGTGDETPQDWYLFGIEFYETLCTEIFASFIAGRAVYESDGSGKLSLTEILFDDDSVDLGARAAAEEYLILNITFVLAPE